MIEYDKEEQAIHDAIIHAREVQEFLWGEISLNNEPYLDNMETWKIVFQKRVDKIAEINSDIPNWTVELKKRLLQQAALSIVALKLLS